MSVSAFANTEMLLQELQRAHADAEPRSKLHCNLLCIDNTTSDTGININTQIGYSDENSFYAYQVDCGGLVLLDYDLDG